mmetsp:Transcript_64236/g.112019  ORF Transcript_64236/g.112019 Transcript_64236/m.112019 type:complete len:260 (-) Transcript_64236:752-1531(-)
MEKFGSGLSSGRSAGGFIICTTVGTGSGSFSGINGIGKFVRHISQRPSNGGASRARSTRSAGFTQFSMPGGGPAGSPGGVPGFAFALALFPLAASFAAAFFARRFLSISRSRSSSAILFFVLYCSTAVWTTSNCLRYPLATWTVGGSSSGSGAPSATTGVSLGKVAAASATVQAASSSQVVRSAFALSRAEVASVTVFSKSAIASPSPSPASAAASPSPPAAALAASSASTFSLCDASSVGMLAFNSSTYFATAGCNSS